MKENKLLCIAQNFAVSIIQIAESLKAKGQRSLSDQLLRSGTSIAANIAEGNHPQSRLDMISKFEIALKEANETENWLTVCHDASLIDNNVFEKLHKQIIQIKILLISSVKTLKGKTI